MRSLSFALLLVASVASAQQTTARLEAGPALPLTGPQRTYFNPGPDVLGTFAVELTHWLDVRVAVGGVMLPRKNEAALAAPGSLWIGGTGLRLRRPWANAQVIPWAEGGFFYALTGGLSRLAVDGGAGVLFRPVEQGRLAVGPFVRYQRVFKLTEVAGFVNADAQLLSAGLSFEYLIGDRDGETDSDGDGFTNDVDECPQIAGVAPKGCPSKDTDGDGILDHLDACPREAGLAQFKGCPDPDPDHDGVLGAADKCPVEAEDRDGFEDDDGCPDIDNDRDGTPDVLDACKMQPGPASNHGCPDPDSDRDGLADSQDACPKQPGPVANRGCPDLDSDHDGVLDREDACPNQPGPVATRGCPDTDGDGVVDRADGCPEKAGPPENQGCPVYKQVVVTATNIELLQKIFFAFGKATILPKSYGLLDEVVLALQDHPKLCVRIEGHTDSVGGRDKNLKLSDDRAWSVMKYVAEHGVDPTRMTAKGYGPDLPLETNATPEGRERNRRVEFVIVPCGKAQ